MRILLTAFEPYDDWSENSSWLTMVELLRELRPSIDLVTRRYPVDLQALERKLDEDLQQRFDAILHLGQAPGASAIKLEAIALNVAGCVDEKGQELPALVPGGPLAFRSQMPLGLWSQTLREEDIPANVSYHAGTFLCNATMYLSHHRCQSGENQGIPIGFVHLPLTTEQVAKSGRSMPSLPTATLAGAIRFLLRDLSDSQPTSSDREARRA